MLFDARPKEAYEALERLAEEKGIEMAEVLRDAISPEQRIEKVRKDKDTHLLIEHNGKRRELVVDLFSDFSGSGL